MKEIENEVIFTFKPLIEEFKEITNQVEDLWDGRAGQHTRSKDFDSINTYSGNKFVLRPIDP